MRTASGEIGRGSYLSLAAALLRGFALAQMHHMSIPDTSHACLGHILHAFLDMR